MQTTYHVENIKCGGCASTIEKALLKIEGVTAVVVDPATQKVVVKYDDNHNEPLVTRRLSELGYPLAGTTTGLASARAKAKSLVSCAIGKFSEKPSQQEK